MDRRAAGTLVLSIAAAALFIVPRILYPGIGGHPSLASIATPPAVGSCVDLPGSRVEVVDCAQPHDAEVTMNWLAADPLRPQQATPQQCITAAHDYLAETLPVGFFGWSLAVIQIDARLVRAPRADRYGGYGWAACVLGAPDLREYSGSLRTLSNITARPAEFGSCLDGLANISSCRAPHPAEQLGTLTGRWVEETPVPDLDDRLSRISDSLRQSCTGLAVEMTGSGDPSYGGLMSVDVWVSELSRSEVYHLPPLHATDYYASCELRTTGAMLTDSIVGWGDAALPIR